MSGKPMDPERLAQMREGVAGGSMSNPVWVTELLADRDHCAASAVYHRDLALSVDVMRQEQIDEAKAEAKRWRSQCPVTAEHVEAAGLTCASAEAWLTLKGFTQDEDGDWKGEGPTFYPWATGATAGLIARTVNDLAETDAEKGQWDILDEMATATPGGDQ